MPLHKAVDHKGSAKHLHHIDTSSLAFETGFSSFALEEFPKYELRAEPMPSAVAEGIITQELELDGNPALNLASFVTTRFDETTHKLCDRMLPVNWIDFDEYPQTVEIHNRCVNIIAHLFHAPIADGDQAVGTSTVGSSEAIMLAVLAMKWRWRAARKAAGKDYARPNMVMGAEVQVCWEKATAYFDVEARYVPLHDDVYVMDPEQAIAQCDENTIGICGILGTTYTGQFEASSAAGTEYQFPRSEQGTNRERRRTTRCDFVGYRQIGCVGDPDESEQRLRYWHSRRCGLWRLCGTVLLSESQMGLSFEKCAFHQRFRTQVRSGAVWHRVAHLPERRILAR